MPSFIGYTFLKKLDINDAIQNSMHLWWWLTFWKLSARCQVWQSWYLLVCCFKIYICPRTRYILGEKTPEIFIGRLQDSWGFSQAVAWRLESSNQHHYTVSKVLKVYFIKDFSFQGNPKDWVVWYQLELNLFSFWSKDFQIHFACGLNYQKLYLHTFISK